jgi:hypothetical protein
MWRTERAEVTMESDLEAAAESGAVDRGERGEGEVADRRERVVPGFSACSGDLRSVRKGELGQVRTGGEDERLAGQHEPAPASRLQSGE